MAKQNNKQKHVNKLRIIGGHWRSRLLEFADLEGLRPTPDRVRETVFNWLQPYISDARCLDLFAGSGALGFEAASRGAEIVTLVESNKTVTKQLEKNASLLKAQQCQIVYQSALNILLNKATQPFDVVFVDPPYQANLWQEVATLLTENNWLADGANIYLECLSKQELPELPTQWQLKKEKKAGAVRYCLFYFAL